MTASEVTLTRDRWGIAHVAAPDELTAIRAQGWVAAADRIWQMVWDRRRATGTWAAVAGPSALAEDRLMRRIDLAGVARRHWSALSDEARAATVAYADGVNAWLDDPTTTLPGEFDHHGTPEGPWEPWHCLAVYKVRHLFMGTLHRKLWRGLVTSSAGPDVARAFAGDLDGATPIVTGEPDAGPTAADGAALLAEAADLLSSVTEFDGGSNSWVLDGTRTASGRPLLAGDPHRSIEFPNVYHQCHLRWPDVDVIGLAFPGVPGFPHFGHNAEVAWCITHGMADDTDLFVERVAPTDVRREIIEVRGERPVSIVCGSSPRGPIIAGLADEAHDGEDAEIGAGPFLAMNWTGRHGVDTTFDCLLPMVRAGSVDDLEEAVVPWVIPVNSLLSADVEGNISFRLRGRVVERPAAARWAPVLGDPSTGWDGRPLVDAGSGHAWRNPERGFLVTANNRVGDGEPYISLDFAGPARHDRIVELLDPMKAATVDDMRTVHGDTRSLVAGPLCAVLASARPESEPGVLALDLLGRWDHDVAADAAGALVYSGVRRRWADLVVDRLGLADRHVGDTGLPTVAAASRMAFDGAGALLRDRGWQLVPGIDDGDAFTAVLGALFDDVGADLVGRFGPDPATWRWADAHEMVSPHPLASARPELGRLHPPMDGCPGDGDTVRAASVSPATGDRAATSSVARYVFDLDDWDQSGWVVPHGVSGDRASAHSLDQRQHWLACELLPMAYSDAAVAAVAVTTSTLRFGA